MGIAGDLEEYISRRRSELRGEEEALVRGMRKRRREEMKGGEEVLEEFREGACKGGEEVVVAGARRRRDGVRFLGVDCAVGEVLDRESRRQLEPWVIEVYGEMRRSRLKVRIVVCAVVWICIVCSSVGFSVLFGVRSSV